LSDSVPSAPLALEAEPAPPAPRVFFNRRFVVGLLVGLLLACVIALVAAAAWEMRSSYWQSRLFSRLASEAQYRLEPGASSAIRFPAPGPYDERLGYAGLPQFIQRLQSQSYGITAQARMSPRMLELMAQGLFPPYPEKAQAGLTLLDCRATPLYQQRSPERVYRRFEDLPPMMVAALLFIENRELLDASQAQRNPAVEWDRLGRAMFDQLWHLVDDSHPSPGGSTLATQIEKYRHSPNGRTDSAMEKLHQMASASLRAYANGPDTLPRRRQIVLDYLNTVPLIARPGFGEIHGVGDGLWAWYGRDFNSLNRLLLGSDPDTAADRALAFKQALSLMVAQRRPAYYLDEGAADLQSLTNSYLRLMASAGAISPALRDAALDQPLQRLARAPERAAVSFLDRKAATALRSRLSGLLNVPRAYDLDRLDLVATSSLDAQVQAASTALLQTLNNPQGAQNAGLYGYHLLNPGDDTSRLTFSFTLFERGEGANYLRVQTDNLDQPFDLNDGARLDLGSTAKLRTLVTYLELIAELHGRWESAEPAQLATLSLSPKDVLSYWARDYLVSAKGEARSLQAMLQAAMLRRYSASPGEGFFTGGGLHHFENFDPEDNSRIVTVGESLRRSVNLSFIRIMRDVVTHLIYRSEAAGGEPGAVGVLEDDDSPERKTLLERFADKEGRTYLYGFYASFRGKEPQAVEQLLLGRRQPTPARLAAVFYELNPQGSVADLSAFLDRVLGVERKRLVPDAALAQRYGAGKFSLADRAYVASVHPLALWLAAYLRSHPQANWTEVVAASTAQRQAAYAWLFKTRHKGAQNVRIRSLLEQRAFEDINQRWRRLGYPFERLTPSYASALGASGDRPAALAELMGIIVNEGVRLPTARIPRLQFAAGTPYETRLALQPKTEAQGEQVLQPEVARLVRAALIDVVDNGTARRLSGALRDASGKVVPIGGKTGTGDQRFDVYGKGGVLLSSRVVNRTATLVFLIGERYFGTVMAYVHEPYAADYRFTSALPAQLLKTLAPTLLPLLDDGHCSDTAAAASAPGAPRQSP
jgi:membrane peptidoglycan carboxypeptidase